MITGLVLAGGSGTRLGGFKPLASLGDRTLVEHVVSVMREVADEVVVSVARGTTGMYEGVPLEGTIMVEDRNPGLGPLEGLVTGMTVSSGDYALVSPCDTPFLSKGVCRIVVDAAQGRDGAVPFINGFYEPLHGAYRTETCIRAFEECMSEGGRKPKDAYDRLDIVPVAEELLRDADPELRCFWNINSLQDLDRAREYLASL